MTSVLIWILAALVTTAAAKAFRKAKARLKTIEFNRYATVVYHLSEPGNIIDPTTGRETQLFTNGLFTNYVFTIDKP